MNMATCSGLEALPPEKSRSPGRRSFCEFTLVPMSTWSYVTLGRFTPTLLQAYLTRLEQSHPLEPWNGGLQFPPST